MFFVKKAFAPHLCVLPLIEVMLNHSSRLTSEPNYRSFLLVLPTRQIYIRTFHTDILKMFRPGSFATCGESCRVQVILGPIAEIIVGKICEGKYEIYEIEFLKEVREPSVLPTRHDLGPASMALLEYACENFTESLTLRLVLLYIDALPPFKHPLKKKVKKWLKLDEDEAIIKACLNYVTVKQGLV
jgi:hypothetical protein